MGLRAEHRELTRQKVLAAVLDLVAEDAVQALSVPAVSKRSGVSVATIYRYFPTKDELLAAAAAEPTRRARTNPDLPPRLETDDDLEHHVRVMWREFGDNLPLLRHQLASDAGRAMRRARLDEHRQELAEYVEGLGVDPASEAGGRLISMIMVVTGSSTLVELHDRQGLAVDDAIDHSLWALDALLDAARRSGSPGRHGERPRTSE